MTAIQKISIWATALVCLQSTIICGQSFNKKYFSNTDWFSNNRDSIFFKADTLKFIKYSNLAPKLALRQSSRKEYAESEMNYLSSGNYVEYGFERHKMLYFCEITNNYMCAVAGLETWKWKFEKKTNLLNFYYNDKLFSTFRFISEKQINIESKYAEQKDLLTTIELTAIRVK
ncbi:MAG: hypothetical protein V4547_00370 [Bacteroidota bacterium]